MDRIEPKLPSDVVVRNLEHPWRVVFWNTVGQWGPRTRTLTHAVGYYTRDRAISAASAPKQRFAVRELRLVSYRFSGLNGDRLTANDYGELEWGGSEYFEPEADRLPKTRTFRLLNADVMTQVISDELDRVEAPFCNTCGHITVRQGIEFKCLNCGNIMSLDTL